jgi:hypothetical protein
MMTCLAAEAMQRAFGHVERKHATALAVFHDEVEAKYSMKNVASCFSDC